MRAVVTRVTSASCTVDGAVTGQIGLGYLVLLGVAPQDTPDTAKRLADKICHLRVLADADGRMNRSLADCGGALLVVPQFTLLADTTSRRPSFQGAAPPPVAHPLYDLFCQYCEYNNIEVQRGVFGAHMAITSCNDGPVTILFDL